MWRLFLDAPGGVSKPCVRVWRRQRRFIDCGSAAVARLLAFGIRERELIIESCGASTPMKVFLTTTAHSIGETGIHAADKGQLSVIKEAVGRILERIGYSVSRMDDLTDLVDRI